MDRTVEDLENSIDRLLGRFSGIQSERDRLASEKSALEERIHDLESRLVSCQENLTRSEAERSRLEHRRTESLSALDTLIVKLEQPVGTSGPEEKAASAPPALQEQAESPEMVVPAPGAVPGKNVHSEQESRFELSVAALGGLAVDREHAGRAAVSGKRIF